ncbi:hypothetical protein, partial [Thiohalocapsa sp. ML1]|uniref:hypothetical protein n=1 Tax=Thiohalocapsa sp. ML1 TaxID=1431688 RepID=UPI001C1F2D7E
AGAAHWDRRLSSRLAAGAAQCRVGGVRADQRAQAQSSARQRAMGTRPLPRRRSRAGGIEPPAREAG